MSRIGFIFQFIALLVCRTTFEVSSFLRVLWYNLTLFGPKHAIPFSTRLHGKILSLGFPCRVRFGNGCRIGSGTWLGTNRTATIELADDVSINLGCVLHASQRIVIGKSTAIAEYVSIRDQEHLFSPKCGVRGQGYHIAPIEIGDYCWIGRGVYIGPGTVIGRGSIVGANSVVKGKFPEGVLVAGVPAKIVRVLKED